MITTKNLNTLQEVSDLYDYFIFDLWGVIHNGKQAFPDALRVLQDLKNIGKKIYFLSNAPRRADAATTQLVERGAPRHLYHDLLTSGDMCYEFLQEAPQTFIQGHRLFHLGPEKDCSLYEGIKNLSPVSLEEADFILNTGPFTFEDTVTLLTPLLEIGRNRNLPMVCANPDLIVLYGETHQALCAGSIAQAYESMGGQVLYFGKPQKEILQKLFWMMKTTDLSKVLMIGDSLRTDIKGANNSGIDSVFIRSGIHSILTPYTEDPILFKDYEAYPTYSMEQVQ